MGKSGSIPERSIIKQKGDSVAKVKIVVTHEEFVEADLGDVPEGLFAESLLQTSHWTLSDMGADWKIVKIEINGKEYLP